MSKSLYNTVNLALDTIFKKLSVTECGIRFSRKDHFIMALHLAHLYENSYPGLSKYNITTIDFISLAFVALIVSPENRSEDKTVIESTDASYVELKRFSWNLIILKRMLTFIQGIYFPVYLDLPIFWACIYSRLLTWPLFPLLWKRFIGFKNDPSW